ncbi:MAG: T9SS type A sorting domain-containing protein [Bacteroidetes bacterium]|nr:T9SS type A sorting domain-containing protein [Bacteroidota bacterium]
MTTLGTYDWSLTESSHCINSGDSTDTSFLFPFDFAGNPRIYNSRVDIGAYEFQGDFVPEIDTSGNDGDSTDYSFSLFPNPTNDILNIKVNSGNLSEINIYDAASRLILRKEFAEIISVNMQGFSKGIYLYEVKDKNGLIKKGKLVKY